MSNDECKKTVGSDEIGLEDDEKEMDGSEKKDKDKKIIECQNSYKPNKNQQNLLLKTSDEREKLDLINGVNPSENKDQTNLQHLLLLEKYITPDQLLLLFARMGVRQNATEALMLKFAEEMQTVNEAWLNRWNETEERLNNRIDCKAYEIRNDIQDARNDIQDARNRFVDFIDIYHRQQTMNMVSVAATGPEAEESINNFPEKQHSRTEQNEMNAKTNSHTRPDSDEHVCEGAQAETSEQTVRETEIEDICFRVMTRLLTSGQIQEMLQQAEPPSELSNPSEQHTPGSSSPSPHTLIPRTSTRFPSSCCKCKQCKCLCHSSGNRMKDINGKRKAQSFFGNVTGSRQKRKDMKNKTDRVSFSEDIDKEFITNGLASISHGDLHMYDLHQECTNVTVPNSFPYTSISQENSNAGNGKHMCLPESEQSELVGAIPESEELRRKINKREDKETDRSDFEFEAPQVNIKVHTNRSRLQEASSVSDSNVPQAESNLKGKSKNLSMHQFPKLCTSAAGGGDPEEPNSSSDSEDDFRKDHVSDRKFDIGRKQFENKELIDKSNWKTDINVWKRCLERKDEQEAIRLANRQILPDQEQIDRAVQLFGISSESVWNICHAVCCFLKVNVPHVVSVWPAFNCTDWDPKKQVTFIIHRELESENETIPYRCYERRLNEISTSCSEENKHIRDLEQNCQKDYSETENIKKCLNKHSKSLMDHHTNITRVSISWFKSKGYGTERQTIKPKTCIAVYVQVKGFVPVNETVIPEEIDGFDVDVREGVVMSYAGPNEHHEHLKMGCAIHCGLKDIHGNTLGGTLGGFVSVGEGTFCISSAHIFFSDHDMEKLKRNGMFCDLGGYIEKFSVYQPVLDGSQAFGTGVRAVYNEGGNGKTGVEVVIIELNQRFPISGEFPECPHRRNPGVERAAFSSGKMYNRDDVNRLIRSKRPMVVKFGCITGWTRGSFRFDGGSARLSHLVGSHFGIGILLHNQFEIDSIGETAFAENGDSGALVFTDENDELSVIGIVVGGMGRVIYVTPIYEVFAALGLPDVQNMITFSFPNQGKPNIAPERCISNLPRPITNRSDSGISSVDETLVRGFEEKFKTLEQDIPQEIARQAAAIKDTVNTSINQEISSVNLELNSLKSEVSVLKSDITSVKSDVEHLKSELKHEIDKSNSDLKGQLNAVHEQMKQQTELLMSCLAKLTPQSPAASTSSTKSS